MNNSNIIFQERVALMKAGTIGTTGATMTVVFLNENGEEVKEDLPEPEEIHTFQEWKARGRYVRKGQKAIARFAIWNHTTKPSKKAIAEAKKEGKEAEEKAHYYLKESCFFALSQTEAEKK